MRRDKFWSRVDKTGDCWAWTGAKSEWGYGNLRLDGKYTRAHRVSWELTHGPIPAGLFVLHECDNPPCCNPGHLSLGTCADNARDMVRRGRHSSVMHPEAVLRGERSGRAKLKEADVKAIRALSAAGVSHVSLAARYGVSGPAIAYAVSRRSWAHVE